MEEAGRLVTQEDIAAVQGEFGATEMQTRSLMRGMTPGRVVHVKSVPNGPCLAAHVAKVDDPERTTINVAVLMADGSWTKAQRVPHTEMSGGRYPSWHWPERVGPG